MDSLSINQDEENQNTAAPSNGAVPPQAVPGLQSAGVAAGTDMLGKKAEPQVPTKPVNPVIDTEADGPVAATPKVNLAAPSQSSDLPGTTSPPAPGQPPVPPPPVSPPPTSSLRQQPAPKRGRKMMFAIIAVIILIAVAAGGAVWWHLSQQNNVAVAPSPTFAPTTPSTSPSPSASASPSASPSPSSSASPSTSPSPTPAQTPSISSVTVDGNGAASGQTVSGSNNQPVFAGTATPNSQITIVVGPENVGLTATAGSDGSWSVTPSADLPNGTHSVDITVSNSAGSTQFNFTLALNVSAASALGQTGDPVALVDLFAVIVLLLSVAGLQYSRTRG